MHNDLRIRTALEWDSTFAYIGPYYLWNRLSPPVCSTIVSGSLSSSFTSNPDLALCGSSHWGRFWRNRFLLMVKYNTIFGLTVDTRQQLQANLDSVALSSCLPLSILPSLRWSETLVWPWTRRSFSPLTRSPMPVAANFVNSRSITHTATATLVHSFVTSRLDYCSPLYAGLPAVWLKCSLTASSTLPPVLFAVHMCQGLIALLFTCRMSSIINIRLLEKK